MTSKVKLEDRLGQFVTRVEQRAASAAQKALILGGSEAAALTPQDTGTLINSQYRNVQVQGTKVIGSVGYTAEYAKWVHEMPGTLKGQPRAHFGKTRAGVEFGGGSGKGVYWGPSGEPQFLKEGFERAADNIAALIKGELKTK